MKKKVKRPIHHKKSTINITRISFFVAVVACFVLAVVYIAKPFKNEAYCANSISCIKDLSGAFDASAKTGVYMGKKINVPQVLAKGPVTGAVLGENTGGKKHIYVDLSTQKLYAKEGDETIYEFPVSTGLWGRTPTGDFEIWVKLKSTRMSGGNQALGTYYDLPNVPFTMFYANSEVPKSMGYSIHGAYWHNNFGNPMSHGCVNMRIEDAEKIYYWADPIPADSNVTQVEPGTGTPITVYGVAPAS